jgi:hypothetical protein
MVPPLAERTPVPQSHKEIKINQQYSNGVRRPYNQ